MLPFVIFVESLPPIIMIVLFALLLGIIAYFFYVYKKEKEIFTNEEKVIYHYEKILTDAHNKARHILTTASKKATRLLDKTSLVKKDVTKAIHQKLAEETAQTLTVYQKELSSLQDTTRLTLFKTASQVAALAQQELEDYRQQMERDMHSQLYALHQRREEEMGRVSQEVEAYKREQMARIENDVAKKIQELATKLLGRSLSLSDHQELIVSALHKAKEEGLFTL